MGELSRYRAEFLIGDARTFDPSDQTPPDGELQWRIERLPIELETPFKDTKARVAVDGPKGKGTFAMAEDSTRAEYFEAAAIFECVLKSLGLTTFDGSGRS